MPDEPRTVEKDDLETADLEVGAIYDGGTGSLFAADPIYQLLRGVGNRGGIRFSGSAVRQSVTLGVLFTTRTIPGWPDEYDPATQTFTYYGDNDIPGRDVHDTPRKGNLLLRDIFSWAYGDEEDRKRVPPILLFESTGNARRVQFAGLAVPWVATLTRDQALSVMTTPTDGGDIENYVARLTRLEVPIVPRSWITGLQDETASLKDAPLAWQRWIETGRITVRAPEITSPHHDAASAVDSLGVSKDVEVLSTLLAARDSQLPLAIALLGQWGSGKSSVMLQMEERVAQLAAMTNDTQLVSRICQIRFNAWDYGDERVWTGLIDRLVIGLTEYADQYKPDDLANQLIASEAERERIVTEIAEKSASLDRLKEVGGQVQHVRNLAQADISTTLTAIRKSWRVMVLGALLIGGISIAVGKFSDTATAIYTSVSLWMAGVSAAGGKVLKLAQRIKGDVSAALAKATKADMETLEKEITALTESQRALADSRADLEARMKPLIGIEGLRSCLTSISTDSGYKSYRGLVGHVRDHLNSIERTLSVDPDRPTETIDRIILYIDDLDRCKPSRVVEVLEAVHLVQADTKLFAIVVAVDPRWLRRALEQHHQHMVEQPADALDIPGTAADYLDKIFQIPYTLRPPDTSVMGSYVRALIDGDTERVQGPEPGEGVVNLEESEAVDDTRSAPMLDAFAPTSDDETPPLVRMMISAEEALFLDEVAIFFSTPRSAKKFVNLYRLLRITVITDDFVRTGDYRVAQVLLAAMTGQPAETVRIFAAIQAADNPAITTEQLFNKFPRAISTHLVKLMNENLLPTDVAIYRKWYARVERYSFHPAFART